MRVTSTGASRRRNNRRPAFSAADALAAPSRDYGRIILPPSTYAQEREKIEQRLPAALRFIAERGLNELIEAEDGDIGIVLQGGLYNNTLRALELLGCADAFGTSQVPLYVLNVTYPLIPKEWVALLQRQARRARRSRRGSPSTSSRRRARFCASTTSARASSARSVLPMQGEYTR